LKIIGFIDLNSHIRRGGGEKHITAAQKCIKILLFRINLMETG